MQLYGQSGYGLDPLGSEDLVESFSPAQLTAQHQLLTAPGNTVIAIYGDIDPNEVEEKPIPPPATGSPPLRRFYCRFHAIEQPSRKVARHKGTISGHFIFSRGDAWPSRPDCARCHLGGIERHGLTTIPANPGGTWSGLLRWHAEFLRSHARLFFIFTLAQVPTCLTGRRNSSHRPSAWLREGLTAEINRAKAQTIRPQKRSPGRARKVAFSACMDELLTDLAMHSYEERGSSGKSYS